MNFGLTLYLCVIARNSFGSKLVLLTFLLFASSATAQEKTRTQLTISIPTTGEVRVDAKLSSPLRSWSFRNAYASALGIAERIENFRAFGDSDQDARVKKSATGEFRSDLDATRISYILKLSKPRATDLPHVSWIDGDRGFLMFADLVPLDLKNLSAEFLLPVGWTVESSIAPDGNGRYEVLAPEKSVFFLGRLLRKASKRVDGMMLETVVSGRWRFNDDDALKAAGEVMEKYHELTGFRLPDKSLIMIAPSPVSLGNSSWKAETRGSSVVVLMDAAARSKNSLGHLRIIFTHELLHLWVPNSLKFEGDYDWFFEGFTMYTALWTALELRIINFKGFLSTLDGAYKYYLSQPDNVSLIEASETRWTTSSSHVYIKGMLIAFLYDLMLRKESAGKATLANLYRDLFNRGVADDANGNEAIIALLGSSPAGKELTKSYIENSRELKLDQLLTAYGLEVDLSSENPKLRVNRKLDEDQKRLLRSLGYRD